MNSAERQYNTVVNVLIGFSLVVMALLPVIAKADTVECTVFSKKTGVKSPIVVRVFLNEFYTYGEFSSYNNAEEEKTLYAPIQRMVYMEKQCHDDFYVAQCDVNQCNFGLVRK